MTQGSSSHDAGILVDHRAGNRGRHRSIEPGKTHKERRLVAWLFVLRPAEPPSVGSSAYNPSMARPEREVRGRSVRAVAEQAATADILMRPNELERS